MIAGALEEIEITIGGQPYRGFTSISISISVEQSARSASVTGSDLAGAARINPGDDVTITAGGDLILTGFVRTITPSHDENSHSLGIAIESKAADAAEASVDHKTGQVNKKDLTGIAKDFDTAGIGIVSDETFPIERTSIVSLGNTLIGHLRPLARSHGAFLYDTPEGKIRIAKKPRGTHSGSLAIGEGGNIISASATISEERRHDEIIVRGQSSRGTGDAAQRLEARAKDSSVKRKRPRIIVHEGEATAAKLKERAERAVKRAAGYSRQASITVAGWRDQGGRIFEPHFLIYVADPRIYIEQMMAINSVTLTQDTTDGGAGTRAVLGLVDPAALNGESAGGDSKFATPAVKGKVTS